MESSSLRPRRTKMECIYGPLDLSDIVIGNKSSCRVKLKNCVAQSYYSRYLNSIR